MRRYFNKLKKDDFPSLYDYFDLGDRVKRVHRAKAGAKKEYKGIILAISEDSIEVYWDTLNGIYKPGGTDLSFTNCSINEIFAGSKDYSPIKKDKSYR